MDSNLLLAAAVLVNSLLLSPLVMGEVGGNVGEWEAVDRDVSFATFCATNFSVHHLVKTDNSGK